MSRSKHTFGQDIEVFHHRVPRVFHIKACMHSTWYTALEQNGAMDESLEKILEMIQEESCLRNPVHSRRMGFYSRRGETCRIQISGHI